MGHDSLASTFRILSMTMVDWREALDLRIIAAGMTPRGVALAAGLGPTAVRDILSGRSRHPRYQTLFRIGRVLGCTAEELINPPDDLDQILTLGNLGQRSETAAGRRSSLDGGITATRGQARKDLCIIPIIDIEAIEDELPTDNKTSGKLALPGTLIADLHVDVPAVLTVRDDAMTPTLNRGDLLLIDRAITRPRRDGIYVLFRPGRVTIRRLRIDPLAESLDIIADNPNYPPITNASLTDIRVLGLAVWYGRSL